MTDTSGTLGTCWTLARLILCSVTCYVLKVPLRYWKGLNLIIINNLGDPPGLFPGPRARKTRKNHEKTEKKLENLDKNLSWVLSTPTPTPPPLTPPPPPSTP